MRKAVESKQVKQQKPQEQPTREKLAGAEQQTVQKSQEQLPTEKYADLEEELTVSRITRRQL